jgi:hypothetical protein
VYEGRALRSLSFGVLISMETRNPLTAKIVLGSHGLGLPDLELVKRRAWEVAQIQEHEVPTSSDWDEARRELRGRVCPSDDFVAGSGLAEGLSDVIGGRRDRADVSLGEELVREGMEEAEHERMLMARRLSPPL